jgi:hypothetical protein
VSLATRIVGWVAVAVAVVTGRNQLCWRQGLTSLYHRPMGTQQTSFLTSGKRMGAALGLAAAATMVVVGVAFGDSGMPATLAGSGEGSAGGVFTQPATPGMNTGVTATWAMPADVPQIRKAAPEIHARG